jgi:hypothetical protein
MSVNAIFIDGLDQVEKAGRFFVDLTQRLADGELEADEDMTRLAKILGIPIPAELAGASIVSLGKREADENAKEGCAECNQSSRIVIHYPPTDTPGPLPGSGQSERTFKKCFKVCKTVGGAKVCAEVCVNISIGLSGIGGKITATVSVQF